MQRLLSSLFALMLVVGVACGSDGDDAAPSDGAHGGHGDSMGSDGSVPGKPGDPSDADREIEIVASDDLSFDPASLKISAGETITFVIRNDGEATHEFVLGDEAYQLSHAADMEDGGHMMESDNAVDVPAGGSAELTWTFTEKGELLFGCHEPGHYEGGMVGAIEVS